MNLVLILQIYVNSFVISSLQDSTYLTIDFCVQVKEFPKIDNKHLFFTYKDCYYYITLGKYKTYHNKYGRLSIDYTLYIGKYFNDSYYIRERKHESYYTIWIIPIIFSKEQNWNKRGFVFSDDPSILKNYKNCKIK